MRKKKPTICGYCAGKVILIDSVKIYGDKSSGMIYLCTNCNASVGVHKGTDIPLGTLANSALKLKRMGTHRIFDSWWKSANITRAEAYDWLSKEMKLPKHHTHIGNFDMEQCGEVIKIVLKTDNHKEAA